MNNQYVSDRFVEIDATFSTLDTAKDNSLDAFLGGYAIVFICGVYEDCTENLFAARAGKTHDPHIVSYVEKTLDKTFRNPDYGKIVGLLRCFGEDYRNTLVNAVDKTWAEALDSIVNNKNSIAHGKASRVTLSDAKSFHLQARKVFDAYFTSS